MKTLADILKESREQAQKTVDVIDKLIAESKGAGVVWPEISFNLGDIVKIISEEHLHHNFGIGELVKVIEVEKHSYIECQRPNNGMEQSVHVLDVELVFPINDVK